jgi:hypothetical protein
VRQPVVTYLTVASEQPGDVGTRATKAIAELEELDPEGVKQARSLMAFGALARARAASADAAAARPAESTAPAATTTAADDATENAVTETASTEPNEFADPANYVKDEEAKPENGSVEADRERPIATVAAETTSSTNENSGSGENSVAMAAATNAASATASAQAASPAGAAPAADGEFNRALVIGVPLAAAALLMGVYWLILRAGAL